MKGIFKEFNIPIFFATFTVVLLDKVLNVSGTILDTMEDDEFKRALKREKPKIDELIAEETDKIKKSISKSIGEEIHKKCPGVLRFLHIC